MCGIGGLVSGYGQPFRRNAGCKNGGENGKTEFESHAGMGQGVPLEPEGEPPQGDLYEPLRHHPGGGYVCAQRGRRQAAGHRRERTVRGREGTVVGTVCHDTGRTGLPHHRLRPLVHG